MLILSNSLKKRFCKDMNIPMQIYDEPYFSERIELLDPYYNTKSKLEVFKQTLEKYNDENEYYKEYDNVKEKAISYLKENLVDFQTVDFNKYKITNQSFPSNNIYKETNIDKNFISIDMEEANFSCLKHFDKNIFPDVDNYKDFIKQFTDEEYFINSKYIRQVIFGNQNPKRQVTYQRYLMDNLLTKLLSIVNKANIVNFSNDEIVIEINDEIDASKEMLFAVVKEHSKTENIRFTTEEFMLKKAYTGYKKVYVGHSKGCQVNFKGLNSIDIIYAIREYENKEVEENDKVFLYENKLAKFL